MRLFFLLMFLSANSIFAQIWTPVESTLTGSTTSFQGITHSWADIDGDGDYDLYTDAGRIWINNANSTGLFTSASLLPSNIGGNWSAAFGDFNNDGKPDLHLAKSGGEPNSLLQNAYPDPFFDVASQYGYDDREFCQPAYWGDYNNDGLLDLYITHENPFEPHEFWQNDYPGDFIPRFPTVGQPDTFGLADLNSHAYGLTWGDIDIDGDIDIVTSACGSGNAIPNQDPHNKVYENETTKITGFARDSFKDRTLDIGVVTPTEIVNGSEAYWATLFDYDNDGFPDLFIGDNSGNHRLWHNTGTEPGDFGFQLVPASTHGLSGGGAYGYTAVAGDWDNDGDLDLYLSNAGLYRNDGGGQFTVTNHVPSTGSFRDASFADYNQDGWLDVFNTDDLYRNPGGSNHWLAVELEGNPNLGTTRGANGVKIRVTTGGLVQTREHRFMVATYSQMMLPTHFGLGSATTVDEVRVFWPNGSETALTNIGIDQQITIAQQADCSGTLSAVSTTDILYCYPDPVPLTVATSNSVNFRWRVKNGPSLDMAQFTAPNGTTTEFHPNQPGSYEISVEYIGCPETAISFNLRDTDFNGDGSYTSADLLTRLPNWAVVGGQIIEDLNASGAFDVRDMLLFCPSVP